MVWGRRICAADRPRSRPISVTTTSRVDATTPVLAQLVDAAKKGFTGSLEVSSKDSAGRDLQVTVWLEDGNIYAVRADGRTPPLEPTNRYTRCSVHADTSLWCRERDLAV